MSCHYCNCFSMAENNVISAIRYVIDSSKFMRSQWVDSAHREVRVLFEPSNVGPAICEGEEYRSHQKCGRLMREKMRPNVVQFYNVSPSQVAPSLLDRSAIAKDATVFAVFNHDEDCEGGGGGDDSVEDKIRDVFRFVRSCRGGVKRLMVWIANEITVDWFKMTPDDLSLPPNTDTVLVRFAPGRPTDRSPPPAGGDDDAYCNDKNHNSIAFPPGAFAGARKLIVSVAHKRRLSPTRHQTEERGDDEYGEYFAAGKSEWVRSKHIDGGACRETVAAHKLFINSECKCCVPLFDRSYHMQATNSCDATYAHFVDGAYWEVRNTCDFGKKVWSNHCLALNVPSVRVLALDPKSTPSTERDIARSILASNKSLPCSVEMIYNDPDPVRTLLPSSWLTMARKTGIKIRTGRFALPTPSSWLNVGPFATPRTPTPPTPTTPAPSEASGTREEEKTTSRSAVDE